MDLKATILIVDDEANNVDMLSQELAEEGYTILTAFDGEEALIKVQDHQPDLILLDVMMPKVDGFTACRILKGSGKTILIPIIMLTALRAHEDRIRGIDAGADDFISKPFDRDELFAKIRSLLHQKRHREEQEHAMREQFQNTVKDLEQARFDRAALTEVALFLLARRLDIRQVEGRLGLLAPFAQPHGDNSAGHPLATGLMLGR